MSDTEQITPPSTVEEVDEILRQGDAVVFRRSDGEIGMRLYHREGASHPIRTVEYPRREMIRYYGHVDQHIRDWLNWYDIDVEEGAGYSSDD